MNIKKCTFAVIIINSKLIKQYHHENSKQHDLKRQFLHLVRPASHLMARGGHQLSAHGDRRLVRHTWNHLHFLIPEPPWKRTRSKPDFSSRCCRQYPARRMVNDHAFIFCQYINVYIRRTLGLGGGTTNHSAYHGPEMGGRSIRLLPVTDPDPRHWRDDLALPV